MKKSLFALAVLGAFAGAAQAQSSVTLYGTLDTAVGTVSNNGAGSYATPSNSTITGLNLKADNSINNVGTNNNSFTGMLSSVVENNLWGMKGTEDLGGGMKSHFNLESQFENNGQVSGALFSRAANVGISGAFGDITVGTQFNPFVGAELSGQANGSNSFAVNSLAALSSAAAPYPANTPPTNLYGTTSAQGVVTAINAGAGGGAVNFFPTNSIRYDLPKFANIEISGLYAFGNNSSNYNSAGNTAVVTAGWSSNGVSLGGGYQKISASPNTVTGGNGSFVAATGGQLDETDYTLYAKYTTGPFSIGGNYTSAQTTTLPLANKTTGTTTGLTMVSAAYQATPQVNIALGYSTVASSSKVNLLGTYAFSKRTYLYAMVDSVNNSSSAGSATFGNFFVFGTNSNGGSPGQAGISSTGVAAGLVTHF